MSRANPASTELTVGMAFDVRTPDFVPHQKLPATTIANAATAMTAISTRRSRAVRVGAVFSRRLGRQRLGRRGRLSSALMSGAVLRVAGSARRWP